MLRLWVGSIEDVTRFLIELGFDLYEVLSMLMNENEFDMEFILQNYDANYANGDLIKPHELYDFCENALPVFGRNEKIEVLNMMSIDLHESDTIINGELN